MDAASLSSLESMRVLLPDWRLRCRADLFLYILLYISLDLYHI